MARNSQQKHELAEAALDGIRAYLKSTRGCNVFGSKTVVLLVPGTHTVQVQVSTSDGHPEFYELSVKNPQT